MEKTRARRVGIGLAVFIGAIILLLVLGILVFYGFATENRGRQVLYIEKPPENPDYLKVLARIISADLNKKTMVVRLSFEPSGAYNDGETSLLARPITVLVSPGNKDQNRAYGAGEFINPMDVVLDTFGDVELYPWDEHEASVELMAFEKLPDGRVSPVPMTLVFEGSEPGLMLNIRLEKEKQDSDIQINIIATRSTVTRIVVWFSIALIWVLAGTVTVMAALVLKGRKLEMVMFPFAGTILFSMVAFRNALPGAPPIGAISDYMGAFWGYTLVTLSLVALTVTWARRKNM